ncbi:MAG: c-type cytochrome [Pseudomonadota bacterium]
MKDSLFSNKLAAAALLTLLLAIGLPVMMNTVRTLASGHHGHEKHDEENPFHLAYIPYAKLEGVSAAAGAEEVKMSLGCMLAEASADRGARGAAICASCHSLEEGGGNGTGPALWNVMGRDIASVDGYGYTSALQGVEGEWTFEKMDAYLYDSQGYVSGTQMAQKIRKDNKRMDILAYLATLNSGEALAFPACEPAGEELADASGVMDG